MQLDELFGGEQLANNYAAVSQVTNRNIVLTSLMNDSTATSKTTVVAMVLAILWVLTILWISKAGYDCKTKSYSSPKANHEIVLKSLSMLSTIAFFQQPQWKHHCAAYGLID